VVASIAAFSGATYATVGAVRGGTQTKVETDVDTLIELDIA
jgi:hypothetical protein